MAYGHLRQYQNLVKEAQRKRIQITKQQQKEIAQIFENIARDFEKKYQSKDKTTLTYRFLEDYAKQLKKNSTQVYKNIKTLVESNMLLTANGIVNSQVKFFTDLCPNLSYKFIDVFSNIPQQAVNELISGEIYKDFKGLSERLWNYKGKFNKDIQYIINQGIIAKKSAYELAKDLEMYLNPKAKKDFDWSKIYPNVNKKIDYSAQRLARTSITHAYQMSFVRSTKDNPFIEKYEWLSSNSSRTCELCKSRNGKYFDKNNVPLDHPNGMCTIVAVIPKSYNEIADELARYETGEENKQLDNWLKRTDTDGIIKENKLIISGHDSTPKTSEPGAIIDHIGKNGKIETRTFYGIDGYKSKDITNHNHNFPQTHPYGTYGEHAHDYKWDEEGKLKSRTTREITVEERKENGDML